MITSKPQIISSALRPPLAPPTSSAAHAVDRHYRVTPAPSTLSYAIAKRTFDLVVSLMAVVLLSPIFFLIYLAIKIEDGGPAILVQDRVGLGGEIYKHFKFRSMIVGGGHSPSHVAFAQQVIRGEITKGPSSNGGLLKPITDARVITLVGKVLRKTSLDELPQLFNVIIGNMSLIGPRPSMDYEVEAYFDWYLPRLSVLPGITGLAQINGRSSIPFPEIARYDLEYIEKRSFLTDLSIFVRTLPVVIGMRNAG